MLRFAFYGRVSTEDQQDPEASRNWQLTRSRALVERHGKIVAEFFDIGQSRALPWKRRPEAARLLTALRDPDRGFDGVVVGEPQRAFYGSQYSMTFPLFVHFGVQLWVPEVGGAVDPESEAHDLVMGVFGGMSKGERTRIKIRVRSAMKAQTEIEGRYLGGRPPYGYRLADAGPHPNPAKAAEGRRLHRLEPDAVAAPVVARIFAEYVAGRGFYAIAEDLTRDGILCPSAHDPARNSHRSGSAWAKSAVRAILRNPRYTGVQVWSKQRKDEVLLDVEDVSLGHETKLRWNDRSQWVRSAEVVHEPLVDQETFDAAQKIMDRGGAGRTTRERRTTPNPYLFRGLLTCGVCDRRMQGQHTRGQPYYRCRYPQEYGLANHVEHPRNLYLAERVIVGPLDDWLTQALAPGRLREAVEALHGAQPQEDRRGQFDARRALREIDDKLRRYRAALEAGADPAVVTKWIKQVTARQEELLDRTRQDTQATGSYTTEQITDQLRRLGDLRQVIRVAEPADKAPVYRDLGLELTYLPATQTVRATAALDGRVGLRRVRGGT